METSLKERFDAATGRLERARTIIEEAATALEKGSAEEAAALDELQQLMIELGVGSQPAVRQHVAGGGSNTDRLLEALGPNGSTSFEIEQATGLTKAFVSATLARLQKDGRVRKTNGKRPGADGRLRNVYVRA
jgi:predicted Rossmann fold nucleotide-binding protein DprA/Smf involved in DNA uptake